MKFCLIKRQEKDCRPVRTLCGLVSQIVIIGILLRTLDHLSIRLAKRSRYNAIFVVVRSTKQTHPVDAYAHSAFHKHTLWSVVHKLVNVLELALATRDMR